MNKEQQRIKIAEACGYGGEYTPLRNSLGKPNCHLPDYLNDLNAMHEAEKILTARQRSVYVGKLFNLPASELESNTFATAYQRAEAFLRTLNLWQEGEL
jgi:hypothetical protein